MENDRLAQDVIEAKKAGVSYGQWMARSYVPPKIEKKPTMTDFTKRCIICGTAIDPKSRRKIYCSTQCKFRSYYSID